ncbi:hypothetical protein V8J36_20765 [Frigidibacter sp. MR17.14]|uniref:hypothetical protein n=1 Tax=Frigidibacter sp. MR17.14 TaxID=3126509 RepID=UPI003012C483
MTDEFVVLLAPLGFGYGLGSMPILLRAVGDRHIAWCLGLAAATALMGYAMANGGAIRLDRWAPTLSLLAGGGMAFLHLRRWFLQRGRIARARREGSLMQIRLRGRQDDF